MRLPSVHLLVYLALCGVRAWGIGGNPHTNVIPLDEGGTKATDPLACTALGYVLQGKDLPREPRDWTKLLSQFGEVSQTGIAFSDAPNKTTTRSPRHLMALSTTKDKNPDKPDLNDRLFIAQNLAWDKEKKKFKSTVVEFQTWSFRKSQKHPIFGQIENPGTDQAEVKVRSLNDCNTCHKHGSASFREFPWSNGNVGGAGQAMKEDLGALFETKETPSAEMLKSRLGIDLFGNIEQYDDRVRAASNLFRKQQLFSSIPEGERANAVKNVLTRDVMEHLKAPTTPLFDTQLARSATLSKDLGNQAKAVPFDAPFLISDVIIDINPVTGERISRSPVSPEKMKELTKAIEAGTHQPIDGSEIVKNLRGNKNAVALAEEGFANVLGNSPVATNMIRKAVDAIYKKEGKRPNFENWTASIESLLNEMYSQPEWADYLKSGHFPERHERGPLVAKSLNRVLEKKGIDLRFEVPPLDPFFKDCDKEEEKKPTPSPNHSQSHACGRCHLGKDATAQILPFDPFDEKARTEWVKKNDRLVVQRWLGALEKRVFRDKDMPPLKQPELEGFSLDSPELESLRNFIQANRK